MANVTRGSVVVGCLVFSLTGCGETGPAVNADDDTEGVDDHDDATDNDDATDSDGATDSDDGDLQAAVEAAFPGGLAVASPTATGMQALGKRSAKADPPGTTIEPGKDYADKQAELWAMMHGETAEDCRLTLPQGAGMPFNPLCYGPSLEYRNHPDAPDVSAADGMLPGGDLGLWNESEGSGEACSAAKLNGLVGDVGLKVDYGLYLAANMLCVMNVEGTDLPAAGESVDMTASVGTSLSTDNVGLTVHAATIARLDDDADGRPVYQYGIDIEQGEMRIDTHVVHASEADDASLYGGKIWSRIDNQPPEGRTYAYSLRYERVEDMLRYRVVGANYPADPTSVFDADGDLALDGSYDGNLTQGIFELDPETGSSNATFAWQAGRGDSHTRVFNVYVDVDPTDGSAGGCGFFGFGSNFTPASSPDNSISTFICNWAGPGNSHEGVVGHAQKQCIERDPTGHFVATSSAISYAPVNDCDTTADPAFEYRPMGHPDWSTDPRPNELVELASDPDYAAWTPPQPPAE